jgi:hypothetical protein
MLSPQFHNYIIVDRHNYIMTKIHERVNPIVELCRSVRACPEPEAKYRRRRLCNRDCYGREGRAGRGAQPGREIFALKA